MSMEIHEAKTGYMKLRRRLLTGIYRNDPFYKDSTTPLLKMLMAPSGSFASDAELIPVAVTCGNHNPLATAVFMIAREMPEVLQMGFFETLPDQPKAISMLVDKARSIARERNVKRIVIGLNGHINNGLGFLADSCDSPASFGSGYNPSYYIEDLKRVAILKSTLVSYLYDLSVVNIDREKKVIERISRRFKVRQGRFGELRKEISIYTKLNNACFKNHPLYYERSVAADYELFKSFGPFLKEENFLISELEGKPIGFLLWYPDFNELVKPGGRLGLGTALKYRMPGNPISKFKIAEFGVLPEHQGSAAIGGLIGRCFELGKENGYSFCESGWIFEDNTKSRGVSERWAGQSYKTYKVFEIDMEPSE